MSGRDKAFRVIRKDGEPSLAGFNSESTGNEFRLCTSPYHGTLRPTGTSSTAGVAMLTPYSQVFLGWFPLPESLKAVVGEANIEQ